MRHLHSTLSPYTGSILTERKTTLLDSRAKNRDGDHEWILVAQYYWYLYHLKEENLDSDGKTVLLLLENEPDTEALSVKSIPIMDLPKIYYLYESKNQFIIPPTMKDRFEVKFTSQSNTGNTFTSSVSWTSNDLFCFLILLNIFHFFLEHIF